MPGENSLRRIPGRWPWLVAGACAVALLLLIPLLAPGDTPGRIVSPREARDLTERGEAVLIDVRSPEEWRDTGVAGDARLASIHNPEGMAGFMGEVLAIVDGDRDAPVILICAAGVRSARARRYLESGGFTNVVNLREGMLGRADGEGWIARGLPVEPCAC